MTTFRCLILITTVLVASCREPGPTARAQEDLALGVSVLEPEDRTLYQSFAATLEGRQTVEIRPKVAGFVQRILVEEGQQVNKGQLLFELETETLSEDARAAEAAVNIARVEVAKLVPLVEKEIVSPVQLETARARLAQAESSYQSIRANIGYSRITSPVSGFVGNFPYKEGALVNNTMPMPLAVVSDTREIRAYFSISEKQLIGLRQRGFTAGQDSVELELVDGSTFGNRGHIAVINPIIDPATGSVTLRADFSNHDGLLSSGSSGRVRIPTAYSDILAIPMTATVDLQGSKVIYILNDDNTVSGRPISIAAQTTSEYLVALTDGLSPGMVIVTEGVSRLRDGQKIDPVYGP